MTENEALREHVCYLIEGYVGHGAIIVILVAGALSHQLVAVVVLTSLRLREFLLLLNFPGFLELLKFGEEISLHLHALLQEVVKTLLVKVCESLFARIRGSKSVRCILSEERVAHLDHEGHKMHVVLWATTVRVS